MDLPVRYCEFMVNKRPCNEEAVCELCIGADGKHALYLCNTHRPSVEEL